MGTTCWTRYQPADRSCGEPLWCGSLSLSCWPRARPHSPWSRPDGRRSRRARPSAVCPRPRRGRAQPDRPRGADNDRHTRTVLDLAHQRCLDGSAAVWKDAERERVLVFSALHGKPPRARRQARRGCLSPGDERSQRQTDRDSSKAMPTEMKPRTPAPCWCVHPARKTALRCC